jgi:hypothetical protein
VWRSSLYSPTLYYPVVLFLSPTARGVFFPELAVFVSQTSRHSRQGSPREHFVLAMASKLCCFFWL